MTDNDRIISKANRKHSPTKTAHVTVPLTTKTMTQKHPKPHDRGMEFECESEDYNVAEFHDKFQNELPKIVKVIEGYYGEIADDVFDRDQIIFIQAVSRQKRVISKMKGPRQQERLFSIPSSYFETFCKVKHNNKVGKEKYLFEILRKSHLPLTVRFPKDRTITVGNKSVSTNNIPDLEMIEVFNEVYLLGNFINNGVMSTDVINVPLYLSQLRFALVTGIKWKTNSEWKSYQEVLDSTSSFLEYDQEFGNPNIAEYDSTVVYSDATYSYVEPQIYSNIVSIMQRPVTRGYQKEEEEPTPQQYQPKQINQTALQDMTCLPEDQDYGGEYEEISNTAHLSKGATTTRSIVAELNAKLKADVQKVNGDTARNAQCQGIRPPLAPKPKQCKPKADTDAPPELPKRRPKKNQKSIPASHEYSNDVPRTRIHPIVVKKDKQDATKNIQIPQTTETVCNPENVPNVMSAYDVTKLTIEEVIVYLKRLGLDQYEEIFRKEKIDGALLVDLDKDTLRSDFSMKNVDILKLRKFANEGHVPV